MSLPPAVLYSSVLSNLPPVPFRTVQYMGTQSTTTDETTTTFSSIDISVPHPKRVVAVAFYGGVAGGVTATLNGIEAYARIQNTSHEFGIFLFQVVTDTSASLVLNRASSLRKVVGVYVFYPEIHTPLDSSTATATTTTDANCADVKVQAGGCLIYIGGQHATLGTFTTTWNGTDAVTENVDAQLEAAASYTFGHINITVSSDASDLNMAESVSGTKRLVAVSLGPPPPRRT